MSDVFSILFGLCLDFLLFLASCYGICWWAGTFDFRRRSTLFRLCLAKAFSLAVTPYLLFLLYRWATPWLILVPAESLTKHSDFLLYAEPEGWILKSLRHEGASMQALQVNGNRCIYLVRTKQDTSP